MKRIALLILIFLGTKIQSQVQMDTGSVFQTPEGSEIMKILGGNDAFFYGIRKLKQGKTIQLDKYDTKNLNIVKSTGTNIDIDDYHNAFCIEDKIYIFSTNKNNSVKKAELNVKQYSKELLLLQEKKKISQVELGDDAYEINNLSDFFNISLSPDNKKFLIITFHVTKNKLINKSYVFNSENLTLLWEKEITDISRPEIERDKAYIYMLNDVKLNSEFFLSNAEDIVFIKHSIPTSSNIFSCLYSEPEKMMVISKDQIKEIPLSLENHMVNPIAPSQLSPFHSLSFSKVNKDFKNVTSKIKITNDTITYAAIFKKLNNLNYNTGIIFKQFNTSGTVFSSTINYFNDDLNSQLINSQNTKSYFSLTDIININNAYYIKAEEIIIDERTGGTMNKDANGKITVGIPGMIPRAPHTVFIQHYSNTIISKLTFDYKIEWTKILPKNIVQNQTGPALDGSSIFKVSGNNLYVFQYKNKADSIDANNTKFSTASECSSFKDIVVAAYKIDPKGNVTNNFFDSKAIILPFPNIGFVLGKSKTRNYNLFFNNDNYLILHSFVENKESFSRFTFNN